MLLLLQTRFAVATLARKSVRGIHHILSAEKNQALVPLFPRTFGLHHASF